MNKTLKTILSIVLLFCIFGLVYLIYDSIMQPVRFNKDEAAREKVAIQQLKDIRDLQVAFKSVNNRFTASFDTLKQFYKNGQMTVLMQVGSMDDSLAVAHTNAIRKANKGINDAGLFKLYQEGDKNLVFSIQNKIAVKDTLFAHRQDFNIETLDEIPFSDGQKIEMDAIVKKVSGVDVPLFEAKLPYRALLKGLDNQLRINLDADRRNQGRYEGLQVGSISAPNNNAGNWE
ncbi:MAG: hypothetical protein MJY86_02995 [Bacteroidales bacterium]|nr:hypothetical protein [Candidatus Cryptobacteroides faecihippi]MCQ2162222.1 hypothetical protein [Bacteroidales bacterium]